MQDVSKVAFAGSESRAAHTHEVPLLPSLGEPHRFIDVGHSRLAYWKTGNRARRGVRARLAAALGDVPRNRAAPCTALYVSFDRTSRKRSHSLHGRVAVRLQDRAHAALAVIEKHMATRDHLLGPDFSAADIMMLFPLTIAGSFGVTDLTKYPHVVAWSAKVQERPAFKKMLQVARPDGVPNAPRALPKQ